MWASYFPIYSGFHTVSPPHAEACARNTMFVGELMTASSRHQGGAHVLMADGAVKRITDSIEAGNNGIGSIIEAGTGPRTPGSQSPYGLWGSLGTRAAKETISADF
jgi:prepilin-type processing-associated H-X9-DG protein